MKREMFQCLVIYFLEIINLLHVNINKYFDKKTIILKTNTIEKVVLFYIFSKLFNV